MPGKISLQFKFGLSYILVILAVLLLLNTYPLLVSQNLVFRTKQTAMVGSVKIAEAALSGLADLTEDNVAQAMSAVEETGVSDICIGGGVAANPELRAAYQKTFGKMGVRVTVPPMRACGDNAAMIGIPALRSYLAGNFAELTLDAAPNAPLGTWSTPDAPVPPTWER